MPKINPKDIKWDNVVYEEGANVSADTLKPGDVIGGVEFKGNSTPVQDHEDEKNWSAPSDITATFTKHARAVRDRAANADVQDVVKNVQSWEPVQDIVGTIDNMEFPEPPGQLMEHLPTPEDLRQMAYFDEVASRGPDAIRRYNEVRNDIPALSPNDIPFIGTAIRKFGVPNIHTSQSLPDVIDNSLRLAGYLSGVQPDVFGKGIQLDKLFPPKKFPDSKLAIGAGREMDKLAAGINELGYDILGTIGVPGMDVKARQVREDQRAKDDVYKEFKDNAGTMQYIGGSLPYIVDQGLIGVPMLKGAGKLLSAISEVPASAVRGGKSAISSAVENATASSNPLISKTAKRALDEIVTPWRHKAMHNANRIQAIDTLASGPQRLIGSAATGALEGGLHYDNTMGEGAVSSLLGTLTGSALAPMLTRATNMREKYPYEKSIMDWAKREGYSPLPGHEYGNRANQRFEAGMLNTNMFANPMKAIDDGNNAIVTRIVAKSMGLPVKNMEAMTPDRLNAHLDTLKNAYNDIEARTIGVFAKGDRHDIASHVSTLSRDKSSIGKSIFKDASDYKLRMDKLFAPRANPYGGPTVSHMSGAEFKQLRSDLKSDIKDYYNKGETRRAEALKPFLDRLDQALERGMGPDELANWKDLNQRWALTDMVLKHGLTETGHFDPKKYGLHQMSEDPKRFLTDNVPERFLPANWTAKLDYMKRHQAGSDLSGMGVREDGFGEKPTLMARLLSPMGVSIPGLTNLALHAYVNDGFFNPVRKGLLNMSGRDLGDPRLYTRALEMSAQPYPRTYRKMEEFANDVKAKYKSLTNE